MLGGYPFITHPCSGIFILPLQIPEESLPYLQRDKDMMLTTTKQDDDLGNREHGTVLERYEYDAYGNPYILDAQYAPRTTSNYGNPYLFTGRRADYLDSGSLKIQYNRNRYYDYYAGRWLTHDPLNYIDGMNLYEYVQTNPVNHIDPFGLYWMPFPSPPPPHSLATKIQGILAMRIIATPVGVLLLPKEYELEDELEEMNVELFPSPMDDCYAEVIKRNRGQVRDKWATLDFSIDRCPGDWITWGSLPTSLWWWLGGAHKVSAEGSLKACCSTGCSYCLAKDRKVDWYWHDRIDSHSLFERGWPGSISEGIAYIIEGILGDLWIDKLRNADYSVIIHWKDSGDEEILRVPMIGLD